MNNRKWLGRVIAGLVMMAAPSASFAAVKTQDVKYAVDGTEYVGFLAYDDANDARRPGILIAPEWVGLNDYSRGRAKQLAEMGYVAFVFDPYGGGKNAADVKQASEWSGALKADRPELRKRITAGLETLRKQDRVNPDKIAAIGYCFGGTTVLELARSGADIAGVVSFHGGLSTTMPAKAGEVTAKVLVCHGAIDPFVPPEEVAAFEKEMQAANVDWQLISYGNAVHSFTNPAAKGQVKGAEYNEKADKRSWEAMKVFLQELFIPSADAAIPPGPNGPMFGHGRRAESIVFVCDCSGWTINHMAQIKRELAAEITGLVDGRQRFNVIFFADGKSEVFSPQQCVVANKQTKTAALEFLEEATPKGVKNATAALKDAARLDADLVYLLVVPDHRVGDFAGDLLQQFDAIKFRQLVRINTIALEGPFKNEQVEVALREIATLHNGSFRQLKAE